MRPDAAAPIASAQDFAAAPSGNAGATATESLSSPVSSSGPALQGMPGTLSAHAQST